jgi:hypothetical protein
MIALPEKAPRVRRGTSGKQGHERNLRKRNRIRIESEKEVKDNEIKKPYHITHGEELRQALRDSRLTGTKHKKKGGGKDMIFPFPSFFLFCQFSLRGYCQKTHKNTFVGRRGAAR